MLDPHSKLLAKLLYCVLTQCNEPRLALKSHDYLMHCMLHVDICMFTYLVSLVNVCVHKSKHVRPASMACYDMPHVTPREADALAGAGKPTRRHMQDSEELYRLYELKSLCPYLP